MADGHVPTARIVELLSGLELPYQELEEGAENVSSRFRPGDVVVYRKRKSSLHPGPHARDIQPAPHGDSYSYSVEKFWRVVALQSDDKLLVRTRKGKQHTIPANDSNLRRTHFWERLLFWRRFPPRASVE
jgi:hypothetical protein